MTTLKKCGNLSIIYKEGVYQERKTGVREQGFRKREMES